MPAAARALSATGAARPLKGIAAMIAGMAFLTLSDAISKQPGDVTGMTKVKIPADNVELKLDTVLP